MAKHLLIMAFLPVESYVRMSILPSVDTPSYCFLLIIFASFQAQCFIIRQKVRENRNIFGLLCLRLIFLFFYMVFV